MKDDPVGDGSWLARKGYSTDHPFVAALLTSTVPIVLTDPAEPDNPIVFANRAFCDLTGYAADEIVGRNCRFLQGRETDPAAIECLRDAIRARETVTVELINYRKGGSTFRNELHVAPVHDADGSLLLFVGSQIDVTERVARQQDLAADMGRLWAESAGRADALEQAVERAADMTKDTIQRVRNSLTLLSSLIEIHRRAAEADVERQILRDVGARIRAVARIQYVLAEAETGVQRVDLVRLLGLLRDDLARTTEAKIDFAAGAATGVDTETALLLALTVTELVISALSHAFGHAGIGRVGIGIERGDGAVTVVVEDDGRGLPDGYGIETHAGAGLRLILAHLARQGARIDHGASAEGGARFTIAMRLDGG